MASTKFDAMSSEPWCKFILISSLLLICLSVASPLTSAQDLISPTTTTTAILPNSNPDNKPTGTMQQQLNELKISAASELIRDWTLRFGRDIHYGTQEATCLRSLRDQFDPAKSDPARRSSYRASIVSIDWTRTHGEIINMINNQMGWHEDAVVAISQAYETSAGNHTFNEKLRYDYVDVHRLHDINELGEPDDDFTGVSSQPLDFEQPNSGPMNNASSMMNENGYQPTSSDQSYESQEAAQLDSQGKLINSPTSTEVPLEALGTPLPLQAASDSPASLENVEWQTPVRYLNLQRHPNFGDVPVSFEDSAVHVPVHIFPGDPVVMNGIASSDKLTTIFKNNFVRNPKLTNQYFASQTGFMRLFPAQKWQIPRTDPDLYDARMRPWYVAGASSRKDVIILVDGSGSMTGSRRDIAKGVVFEILDTLTDNDHFLILKFSDIVQQVGVPSCLAMEVKRKGAMRVPIKNSIFNQDEFQQLDERPANETNVDALYLLPATLRNVRQVKTNFTIATSGIANFSHALVTAFEVLRKYQDTENLGSQCNQAIMLITDGSPSDFDEVFNRYNYPNAPVRVFTYLIGREASDGSHTKMMACHNRGFYTHVINLAEVRETVQQYIPVMARPLVLNKTHPIVWTPAYAELTYQILTDWIWESRRREKARGILAAAKGQSISSNGYVPDIRVTNDEGYLGSDSIEEGSSGDLGPEGDLESIDLFGYHSNPDCFWETRRNDLLTTVVRPVYDTQSESQVIEKYLNKNNWLEKVTLMRSANLLGVAAADMKINDIIALAPSHKLGPNGYAIMLNNNGLVMHHPDLRSILEPFSTDPNESIKRILKPLFSSLDFTQVEHVLDKDQDSDFLALRKEAVAGLTGWRELITKRTQDCQQRVQSRRQSFYYKPLKHFPFSFMISIPQPYGSHRVEAQVDLKNSQLPERLTTYFTTSDFDIWTVHPDYEYCDGPANNTVTTLLDMFHRIEESKFDDIQRRPVESAEPPIAMPGKIVCDMDLVQSLVYDAVATFGFAEACGPPSPSSESSLLGMFGVRFAFLATRSGLTRVRHYDADDITVRREALAFAKKHNRAMDETYYARTVDYNLLVNDTATLVQVPFNTHLKIRERLMRWEEESNQGDFESGNIDSLSITESLLDNPVSRLSVKDMSLAEKLQVLTNSSLHVIATQSIIVNEGTQRAVAGVTGVFYDYASFVMRLLNTTSFNFQDGRPKSATCYNDNPNDEACNSSKMIKCGLSNDTIDCLLIDNNGYIIVSEDLDFIGRHLTAYEPIIMNRLVGAGVFQEINVTDYQSTCMRQEEKQTTSSAGRLFLKPAEFVTSALVALVSNFWTTLAYSWSVLSMIVSTHARIYGTPMQGQGKQQQMGLQPMLSMLPNKTYLRPCERVLTRYETRPGAVWNSGRPEYYTSTCECPSWFVYEQVPKTNLIMLIVETTPACRYECPRVAQLASDARDNLLNTHYNIIGTDQSEVCSMLEREFKLYRKKLSSCFSHHPEEEHIKFCGAASKSAPICNVLLLTMIIFSFRLFSFTQLNAAWTS